MFDKTKTAETLGKTESVTIREFSELPAEYGNEIEEQRQAAFTYQALEVQELIESLPFDARLLYCTKTGQPRGERDWSQIYNLVALHDRDKSKLILGLMREEGCAVHWSQTDGATLNQLRIIDPVGYFVYAASYLTMHNFKAPKVTKQEESEARARLFQHKITVYAKLSEIVRSGDEARNMQVLHVANGHLRNILNYNPALLGLKFASPLSVLEAFSAGLLYSELSKAFKSWIARENEYLNMADLFETLQKSMGPGQFRSQRKSNKTRRVDEMIAEMANFGIDIGAFREPPRDRAWLANRLSAKFNNRPEIEEPAKPEFTMEKPRPGSFAALFGKGKKEEKE